MKTKRGKRDVTRVEDNKQQDYITTLRLLYNNVKVFPDYNNLCIGYEHVSTYLFPEEYEYFNATVYCNGDIILENWDALYAYKLYHGYVAFYSGSTKVIIIYDTVGQNVIMEAHDARCCLQYGFKAVSIESVIGGNDIIKYVDHNKLKIVKSWNMMTGCRRWDIYV